MHNKYLHDMHTQVNNPKVSPYWKILTCKIQINYYIYIHIIETTIMTPIGRHLNFHQLDHQKQINDA